MTRFVPIGQEWLQLLRPQAGMSLPELSRALQYSGWPLPGAALLRRAALSPDSRCWRLQLYRVRLKTLWKSSTASSPCLFQNLNASIRPAASSVIVSIRAVYRLIRCHPHTPYSSSSCRIHFPHFSMECNMFLAERSCGVKKSLLNCLDIN